MRIFNLSMLLCMGAVFAQDGISLPREMPGVHNLIEVMPGLLSGSGPDADAGFTSLKQLGVKTIISVDGAKPDLDRAKKAGMRYVHLPIGYNGIPETQALRIARAVRDLPRPIYVHCHHGKHRGPAAAAVARLCIDDSCTVSDAIAFMMRAGTDKRYSGLYEAPKTIKRPTKEELDRTPADFPETTRVSALAQVMVEIDEHWDHLKLVRKSGWKTPSEHPDLNPLHEVATLAKLYASPKHDGRKPELQTWLADAVRNSQGLDSLLRKKMAGEKINDSTLESAYQRMAMDCTRCHARFRDAAPK